MDTLLSRHLPIITNRLEFSPHNIGSLPVITPRIDFTERLKVQLNRTELSTNDTENDPNGDSGAGAIDNNVAFVVAPANQPIDVSSDSGAEETDLIDTVNKKIPKPRGQAGHPGSGGYSLDVVLRKWGLSLITDVNKLVKRKADQLLDTSRSYRMQNSAEIDDICIIIEKTFPVVGKYKNHWPVRDMLKQHLKYTSESFRKEESSRKKGKGRRVGEKGSDKEL